MIQKNDSWKMFNQISKSYDFLNNFLSLGIHHIWKQKLVNKISFSTNSGKVLDAATGTGDILYSIMDKFHHNIATITGLDLSKNMMEVGKQKLAKKPYKDKVTFLHADACKIPFDDQVFDIITISFGIRNVPDVKQALAEMKRVLNNTGKLMILEFSIPTTPLFRSVYLFYFRKILPFLGGLFSGKFSAYKYLNESVEDFPYGEQFKQLMLNAGFTKVESQELGLGIATIYEGYA
ncbi:bifunctional demethylmenaquinone methyltransferase/2-methoxy-6-polyprenyl-1,4-benzoquinol methylase UbiE [Candidatus Marinamargulisbacteria bacterium SCGC AG-414-C22]|nr:bifunctional demethylmenaquinone methyltransferase/2-methoxy-6-polyprenyl-1,4-benzoquinol methylase UbiE [Candidatus Marinamargulisbacteria bacterium SCGC AG-414-C22]